MTKTYDSTADTLEHIGKVQARIGEVIRASYRSQKRTAMTGSRLH
jgi:hypothetical protein